MSHSPFFLYLTVSFFSLEVNLPKTRLADIALDVRQSFVRVLAPSYQLKAYLPELVDEQKG
tara:strand:+ start:1966 stop:2148 length:183 start_codon:yes stop_codon:yes gene_type:complete